MPKVKETVLDGAFVPDFGEHVHKGGGFFLGEALHDIVDGGWGIAQTGRRSQQVLRLGGVGNQCDFHKETPSICSDMVSAPRHGQEARPWQPPRLHFQDVFPTKG